MAGRKFIFRQGQGDRGATVVLIALLLPLLIGLLGLAVDFGMLFMHHSRLQHAADAMALAGVRVNVTAKEAHLLSLSDAKESEDGYGLSFHRDEKDYVLTFKTSATDTDEYRKAEAMLALDTNAMEAKRVKFASSLFDGNGAKAYKVTLTENFATSFLKVFGVNEYPVKVQALAVVVPGSIKEDILKTVKSIFDVAPNYYWEDLGWETINKTYTNPHPTFTFAGFSINEDNPETFTVDAAPEIQTPKNMYSLDFFNADVKTRKEFLMAVPYMEITQGQRIASYKDRETDPDRPPVHKVKEDYKFCAAPIEAVPRNNTTGAENELNTALNSLYGIEWKLDKTLIDTFFSYASKNKSNKSDDKLKALYVDRPNIRADSWKTANNSTVTSARIRATVLTVTGDNWGSRVASPLYVRFESEPVLIYEENNANHEHVTVVQPITINVTGNNPTPMIIAYDGPSRLRGESKVKIPGTNQDTEIMEDVPYVNYNKPTEIQPPATIYQPSKDSPWELKYFNNDSTIKAANKYLRLTSVTESPPVTINLKHDFKGIIYVPFSKAIIKGTGKIEGFILAHELEFVSNSDSGRTQETLKNFVLPVLMPEKVAKTGNHVWNYTTISEQPMDYQIVYNKFTNYMEAEN